MTPKEQLIQEVLQAPEGVVEVLLRVMALLRRGGWSFQVDAGQVPLPEAAEAVKARSRPFGLCAGEFEVPPDDFDTPLPDSVLSLFEG